MKRLAAAALLGLAAAAPAQDAVRPRLLQAQPPRDSGHHLGDLVETRALLAWPPAWEIDRDGLAAPAGPERPVELRSHRIEPGPRGCADCRWLTLRWQIFKGPRATEDLRLPALPLRLRRGDEVATVELPAAVVAVSPLVPWDSRRDWLDSVRPGWVARPFDSAARVAEAGGALALAAAALLLHAWATGRLAFGRPARPFAAAWRALRRRPAGTGHPADAEDLRHWHRAFDASAGATVFADDLDDFFAARPALAPLAPASQRVFEASRRRFFLAEAGAAGPTRGELIVLLRQLARAEFEAGAAGGRGRA